MLNRRQAIIRTNPDPIHWCIYAAQGGDELQAFCGMILHSKHQTCKLKISLWIKYFQLESHLKSTRSHSWQCRSCFLSWGPISLSSWDKTQTMVSVEHWRFPVQAGSFQWVNGKQHLWELSLLRKHSYFAIHSSMDKTARHDSTVDIMNACENMTLRLETFVFFCERIYRSSVSEDSMHDAHFPLI